MGAYEEQLALEFLRCCEGENQDVDGLTALMSDDIVWQINVPSWRSRIGREAARAELQRANTISTGLLPGSEIRHIASNERAVFVERVDVFRMGEKTITLHINAVLEVEDGKIVAWREYYDSVDLAKQLGVDAGVVVET
jgi:limonene-1,2-epoxide hydrolase